MFGVIFWAMLARNISFPIRAPICALSFSGQWDKQQALFQGPSSPVSLQIAGGSIKTDKVGTSQRDGGGGRRGSDGEAGLEEEGPTWPMVSCTFHLTFCSAWPPPLRSQHIIIKEGSMNSTGVGSK